ncbi:DUF1127 domain-containing protein [Mesorhizobium sp. M1D.F.Ca.ET.184.01.1.1]|nr:DUF1127 domain-containing protein [Mesorhizobium sp. M1D.F.Ca.ET.231.01.1.1]TGP27748.1 DUF1127 domain-containing protein [Mesorhizobium sp. M1D.F.Ca.ET.234.01.1.1]TGS42098.1 DUF1127 domain-containing protein [Mesorhizobium sp. M1D.F.Ca.ET.184.01.1.1]TGS59450.1 DUF1127 domain-containing protein [Mesorhizobium sp. M1D.F.Ca.ET.183.01.1.1]TIT72449.1 MAG: DUF1127 domain-containing protein [Mesorhizobium sp.]
MEMTMTTFDHATYETRSIGFNLLGPAGRALRLAYHAMRLRSDRAALRAMPDYLLKDMGISRSQIEYYTSARGALAEADRTPEAG